MILPFSYLADLVFGDPEWFPHPVRGMGRLIDFLDINLRARRTKNAERIEGIILVFLVLGITVTLGYLFLFITKKINPYLGWITTVYLGYTTLSVKDLRVKAKNVLQSIKDQDLSESRKQISKIVGRDTKDMDKEDIIRATVESIAENTNDGIIAPLFYLIIGGPLLALAYKAINTLDSMVGYKNERYMNFGWFAARLDDLANLIPARISAVLICLTSKVVNPVRISLRTLNPVEKSRKEFLSSQCFFTPLDARYLTGQEGHSNGVKGNIVESFRIMASYGKKHPSPNSGYPEAAMAGALNIKLGGPGFYQGIRVEKPILGEGLRDISPALINEALLISLLVSLIMVGIGVLLRYVI